MSNDNINLPLLTHHRRRRSNCYGICAPLVKKNAVDVVTVLLAHQKEIETTFNIFGKIDSCDDRHCTESIEKSCQSIDQGQENFSQQALCEINDGDDQQDKHTRTDSEIPIHVIVNGNDCDDDSVSSFGDEESLSSSTRSIFSGYWDVQKEASKEQPSTTETVDSTIPSKCDYDTKITKYTDESYQELNYSSSLTSIKKVDGYELALREYEDGLTTLPRAESLNDNLNLKDVTGSSVESTASRRRIFEHQYSNSLSRIPSYHYSSCSIQKASSTSALLHTRMRRRSCLRPLGRSKSVSIDNGSLSKVVNNVTFDPTVSVHEYDKPYEISASDGWSKWFV